MTDHALSPASNRCHRLAYSLLMAASLALAACDTPMPDSAVPLEESEATPEAVSETCWEALDRPAASEAGSEPAPAENPESAPSITRFQIPCPSALPADFTASLQRALAARGLYQGAITGRMNAATRAAVRSYQQPDGINSDILSLAAARRLGLVAIELSEVFQEKPPSEPSVKRGRRPK